MCWRQKYYGFERNKPKSTAHGHRAPRDQSRSRQSPFHGLRHKQKHLHLFTISPHLFLVKHDEDCFIHQNMWGAAGLNSGTNLYFLYTFLYGYIMFRHGVAVYAVDTLDVPSCVAQQPSVGLSLWKMMKWRNNTVVSVVKWMCRRRWSHRLAISLSLSGKTTLISLSRHFSII